MARILYGSWFSTFARKVALALELKGLGYEHIDALQPDRAPELKRVNPRAEVPVLSDDGLVVINSSDILQYLEWRYPDPSLYPQAIPERVASRALERLADHRFDPIVVDTSFWQWAERNDSPPAGLAAAGQADFDATLARLEAELAARPKPWPFHSAGVVECAWFPNLAAARPLGFRIDAARVPTVVSWLAAMREHPVFAADRKRVAEYLKDRHQRDSSKSERIYWSGDRIEWFISRGFHDWFVDEIKAGRSKFTEG